MFKKLQSLNYEVHGLKEKIVYLDTLLLNTQTPGVKNPEKAVEDDSVNQTKQPDSDADEYQDDPFEQAELPPSPLQKNA